MIYSPSDFKDHYILMSRKQGTVQSLKGDVIVVAFFVNDTVSRWTQSAIDKYKKVLWDSFSTLISEAKKNSIELKFRMADMERTATVDCDRHNRDTWIEDVTCCDAINGVDDYQEYYRSRYPCDELAILFIFNKDLRDYSVSANRTCPTYGEFAVLSRVPDKRTIIHELLHQFGAKDYYYPAVTRQKAEKWLPDSVMNVGYKIVIDPLTRHLVGWTEFLSESAYRFLKDTSHITYEYVMKELSDLWKKEEENN